jgi:hypothetical protein
MPAIPVNVNIPTNQYIPSLPSTAMI